MKKITILAFVAISASLLFSCGSKSPAENNKEEKELVQNKFGDTLINAEGAVEVARLKELLEGKDSIQIKLNGTISSVCQKKGCWMKMTMDDSDELFVRFKDYGFFVPLNCSGQSAVMEGIAKVDTISVRDQKHYASDAGKSEEEIDAITEPSIEYSFEATGVMLEL